MATDDGMLTVMGNPARLGRPNGLGQAPMGGRVGTARRSAYRPALGRAVPAGRPCAHDLGEPHAVPRSSAAPAPLGLLEFQEVYACYRSTVISLLRHYLDWGDIEDATQEVFAEAWRAWERYDPARFSHRGWLVGIARHVALDRRSAAHRSNDHEDHGQDAATFGLPDRLLLDYAERAEIRALIMRLSTRNRRIILMRFVLGYSRGEIGAALGMTEAAVAKRIGRTLCFLRSEIGVPETDAC